ncbi:MmpS family transport accessory protein [Mycobacterium sp. 663a-19]|uniref:MmpS family transport accessory protein n=1 Tax=Mycobacterium sp. 663a-19 TaxID=2986148 RepID=UPI002D1E9741|nr:MmpS family transport accessory protein [Mycobacterium sp. 663a-19]MEB3982192.1 MmpS family transport accessory protein [Mycobacterium sp. 663a-19]
MGTTLPPLDKVRVYPGDYIDYIDADTDDDTEEIYPAGPHADGDYSWTGWPAEFRLRPLTAILGAAVALGAITTAVVINSGDSASTKATVGAPVPHTVTSAPRTTNPPSTSPSASATALPPETVTTVTTPSAAPTRTPGATQPPTVAPTQPPTAAAPPPVALNPRTVVYTVTGTKQLFDLVNVVYTDAQGYPQTEFNVSLPWSKVIVLNPGVQTESVIATSIYGRLNCGIVNAAGETVKASTNNTSVATCTR